MYRSVVSIHVPARGTTIMDRSGAAISLFQSTFPQGERQLLPQKSYHTCFNPRSRKGNDRVHVVIHFPVFQSTFPQGERPAVQAQAALFARVSIHVPARGTTFSYRRSPSGVYVSIHVPARGTTFSYMPDFVIVSIHVPARGTTCIQFGLFQSTFPQGERLFGFCCFNPRSRKGNDR